MKHQLMKTVRNLAAASLGAVIFSALSPAWALDEKAEIMLGKNEYMGSCASCHGADAMGDGPAAASLSPKPADLTKIAQRNNGTFPSKDIYAYVDGQKMIGPHGNREMPVWGYRYLADALERAQEVPHDVDPNAFVHDRIAALVKFLESIQVK